MKFRGVAKTRIERSRAGTFAVLLTVVLSGSFLRSESDRWEVPVPDREFHFPEDHGSHPSYKWERWEIRCHLFANDRRLGLRAIFLRLGRRPSQDPRGELFGDSQIHLARISIADPESEIHLQQERRNRSGWNAFSRTSDLDIRNGDWRLTRSGDVLRLRGSVGSDAEVELRLRPHKRLVFLEEGGETSESDSRFHYTYSKIDVEGTMELGGASMEVYGKGSFDHEIAAAPPDDGTERAHLMLLDDHEILVDSKRESDLAGSSVTWIDPSGEVEGLSEGEYQWTSIGEWKSPRTGAVYPVTPRLKVQMREGREREFMLQPILADQEAEDADGHFRRWDGACDVLDAETSELVGWAYLNVPSYSGDSVRANADGM